MVDRGELEEYLWGLIERRKAVARERERIFAEYNRTVYDGMEIPNGCMHAPKPPGPWYIEQMNGALEVRFDVPDGWVEDNDSRAFFVTDDGLEPVEVFFNDERSEFPGALTDMLLEHTWSEIRVTDDYAALVTDAVLAESEPPGMATVVMTVKWERI
ncbi:MAG: hypothetical protein JW885_02810 [Deltaproteobacteria bacterium]|nr:hypothetical protein [Candidatus Zymogenaceae bacterium]